MENRARILRKDPLMTPVQAMEYIFDVYGQSMGIVQVRGICSLYGVRPNANSKKGRMYIKRSVLDIFFTTPNALEKNDVKKKVKPKKRGRSWF